MHDHKVPATYREGKKSFRLSGKRGRALDICATLNHEYICCNIHVLRAVSNCPYDCSYCFLQNYLTDHQTTVVADIDALMSEVTALTTAYPRRFFRIGTWELGDSLALEEQSGCASALVKAFARLPNALLELKTKSACVNRLLDIEHNGRTVVSWSLNPERIIRQDEHKTAHLSERLLAMSKVCGAGYPVGLHFDPMIVYDGWEQDYQELVETVFSTLPTERIAWISIGSLRFNPEMKKLIEYNFPKTRITSAEMILGGDNKVRYVKPLRITMYKHLYDSIIKYGKSGPFVYLCMERWDVWEKIFGHSPRSINHLDYLITSSLHLRFPGLVHEAPELSLYDTNA